MSKINLGMALDRLGMGMEVSVERRGLLMARICVSDDVRGDDVTILAGRDGKFNHSEFAEMLRVFADRIEQKYNDQKDAA